MKVIKLWHKLFGPELKLKPITIEAQELMNEDIFTVSLIRLNQQFGKNNVPIKDRYDKVYRKRMKEIPSKSAFYIYRVLLEYETELAYQQMYTQLVPQIYKLKQKYKPQSKSNYNAGIKPYLIELRELYSDATDDRLEFYVNHQSNTLYIKALFEEQNKGTQAAIDYVDKFLQAPPSLMVIAKESLSKAYQEATVINIAKLTIDIILHDEPEAKRPKELKQLMVLCETYFNEVYQHGPNPFTKLTMTITPETAWDDINALKTK